MDTASGPRNALLDGEAKITNFLPSFCCSEGKTRRWAVWSVEWTPLSLTRSQPGPRRPHSENKRPQPHALPLVLKHITGTCWVPPLIDGDGVWLCPVAYECVSSPACECG